MSTKSLWDRIEQSRARWNVLEHPFYQRWSAGELSRDELAGYAGQYRHAVGAIATMSAAVAEDAPAEAREELARHAEEEAGHVELWDGFTEAVGGDADAAPAAETRECLGTWSADGGLLPTLARLYAIESGQPRISEIKREGLREHYGVPEGRGTAYFRVHQEADTAHAAQSRRLIEELARPDDEERLVAAAESAFKGNWRLLDGV